MTQASFWGKQPFFWNLRGEHVPWPWAQWETRDKFK